MSTQDGAILIVEDEQLLQYTLAVILRNAGYQVNCASRGREVEGILQQHASPLVLLDLNLPDIDGLKLLSDLHNRYPSMRIMVFTADGRQESIDESFQRGACDYMIKPMSPETILARVATYLSPST